jgi:hypothetical protein
LEVECKRQILCHFRKASKEKEEIWSEEIKYVNKTQSQREERNKKAGKAE